MSYQKQRVALVIFTILCINFGYTNCSPVHQNDGSSTSSSNIEECNDFYLDAFEKTFFTYQPTSTTSCSSCHSSNYFISGDSVTSWGLLVGKFGGKDNALSKLFANAKGENPSHGGTPPGSVSAADVATIEAFQPAWDEADQNCFQ